MSEPFIHPVPCPACGIELVDNVGVLGHIFWHKERIEFLKNNPRQHPYEPQTIECLAERFCDADAKLHQMLDDEYLHRQDTDNAQA